MTIAIDCRCLQGGQGGVDIYVRSLLNELFIHAPHHRFILFFNGRKSYEPNINCPENVKIITTHIPSKLFHSSLFLFHRPFLDLWIERHARESIDVLFAPNLHFFSVSRKTKVIATIHDLSFVHFKSLMSLRSRAWHHFADIFRFTHAAARIIAVSQSTQKDIINTSLAQRDNVVVIPLGIDPQFYEPGARLPIILAFCPQERRKNINTLIEAFARAREISSIVRDMRLVIGGMHTHAYTTTQRTLEQYGISNYVRLVGYLSPEKRIRLIRSCSLMVYPSIYEGFGMPPLEACASGIPVIAAAHSSIMEVCGNAIWYIDPYNSEQMSTAIIHCLSSETIRNQAGMRGPHQASSFSWRTCAMRTLSECEDIYKMYANRH